ncbi:MAG: tRNA dihydrouridine(20/20a) synthase DusA [Candidatus Azotimanducaceae bacterium]
MDRRLSVAPMMGCTDRHFRFLLRLLSTNSILYSEMIVTGALLYGEKEKFLAHNEDAPCGFQLGGSNPKELAEAAILVEEAGYQEVNINCGCPSDRVQVGGIGACLMAKPELVADCYQAMSSAVDIPVTVKSRIGIDESEDYSFFKRFVLKLYDVGCRTFVVHARKAILKGLTPKENRDIPPLKYNYIYRIKDELPEATFILNGGIKTVEECLKLKQLTDGLMLGRAIYSDPYLLARLDHDIFSTPLPSRLDILEKYRSYMLEQLDKQVAMKHMIKHLLGYFTGTPGARHFRRYLSAHMFEGNANITLLDNALEASNVTNNLLEKVIS